MTARPRSAPPARLLAGVAVVLEIVIAVAFVAADRSTFALVAAGVVAVLTLPVALVALRSTEAGTFRATVLGSGLAHFFVGFVTIFLFIGVFLWPGGLLLVVAAAVPADAGPRWRVAARVVAATVVVLTLLVVANVLT